MPLITKAEMKSAYSNMTIAQLDGDCSFTYVHLTNRCLPLSIDDLNDQLRKWKICEKTEIAIHRCNPKNHKNFITDDGQLWYGCFVQRYTMDLEFDEELNPPNPFALLVAGYAINGLMYAFKHEAVRNSFVDILNFKWKEGYIFELKSVTKLLEVAELYKKTILEFYCDEEFTKLLLKHFPDFIAEKVDMLYTESMLEDEEYTFINREVCEERDFEIMHTAVNKLSEMILSQQDIVYELERWEEGVKAETERLQEIQRQADAEIELLRKKQVKESSRENQEKQEKKNSKKANKDKDDKATKAKQHAESVKEKELLRIKMEKEKKHKANNRSR